MDATALRWTLAIIGIALLLGIYLFGVHQNRLRKRTANETFSKEEIDSAFIEDEQLRVELENLNHILNEKDDHENFSQFKINPAIEADLTPINLPEPELCMPDILTDIDDDNCISYLLKHPDHRLITGEEIASVVKHIDLELNADGYLQYKQDEQVVFRITSLSEPGHFIGYDQLEYSTYGFCCFITLEKCDNPAGQFESMLKKIDEMVRLLNVKVYKSKRNLLTISDITHVRKMLIERD